MAVEANDLKLPPEFSGPAQLILFTRYDDPRSPGWENKWLSSINIELWHPWFPVREIKIHKHFWPILHNAFTDLELLGLHTEINSYYRCHDLASLHSSPVLSVHGWGVAIDLNAEENPQGSIGKWSAEFIGVMEKHSIYCGQNWTGIKEPMHFAMVNGE